MLKATVERKTVQLYKQGKISCGWKLIWPATPTWIADFLLRVLSWSFLLCYLTQKKVCVGLREVAGKSYGAAWLHALRMKLSLWDTWSSALLHGGCCAVCRDAGMDVKSPVRCFVLYSEVAHIYLPIRVLQSMNIPYSSLQYPGSKSH